MNDSACILGTDMHTGEITGGEAVSFQMPEICDAYLH